MRNLFQLLLQYHVFFLFLVFQGISFLLILSGSGYQSVAIISSANSATGSMYEFKKSISGYLSLKGVNDSLAAENARLSETLILYSKPNPPELKDSCGNPPHPAFSFIPARVVNHSFNRLKNFITLDKGTQNGIQPGMGVMTAQGVVGIVHSVSAHYASVLSLLNQDFNGAVKLVKHNHPGRLIWTGGDYRFAEVEDIPKHIKVLEGDTVVTSGFSAFFPENIPIGTIETVKLEPGENFYRITIKLFLNFSNLEYVYVVNHHHRAERLLLESHAP